MNSQDLEKMYQENEETIDIPVDLMQSVFKDEEFSQYQQLAVQLEPGLQQALPLPQPQPQPLQQQQQHEQQLFDPPHLSRIPHLGPIHSLYEFEVVVPADNNNIEYNDPKLFIKMNSKMIINVAYRQQIYNEQLFVRAMIILSNPAEMHVPVKRCANHRIANNDNILKINDPKAMYCGDKDGQTFSERLSVLVPLESMATDDNGKIVQNLSLEFACQNSCSSGINRKPTSIVFTLEKINGELIGKSAIEFKVCSCPKRDAEREKKGNTKKRKSDANGAYPRGKRPKEETMTCKQEPEEPEESEAESTNESSQTDQNATASVGMSSVSITLPTLLVPELLQQALNMVAGKVVDTDPKNPQYNPLLACLRELKKQRKELAKTNA